ncbi:hypothetical protein SRIMM317S_00939 [Streptomyces rimosus subsp. rimosus]
MPVPVPGVCGQAAKSVSGLPTTCSGSYANRSRASSFQKLMQPPRSTWTTATRTRLSARGRTSTGSAGPAERVPAGRSGRSSWNQTCFCEAVYSTPQRLASAPHSSSPRPPSRSGWANARPVFCRGISRSG